MMMTTSRSSAEIPDVSTWASQAQYSAQENLLYQGNPLIEALPPLISDADLVRELACYPEFAEAHRLLPASTRLDMLENIPHIYHPLNKHFDIHRRLSRSIRGGYVGRARQMPVALGVVGQTYRQAYKKAWSAKAQARGFYIIGESGMGKTSSVERLLGLYPQAIWHPHYREKGIQPLQLAWLKLDCPPDGSIKALCQSFFVTIDQLLGTNYYACYGYGRTSDDMQIPIAFLAGLLQLGVLVIDEIQNLNRARSGGAAKMLSFFVSLANTVHVPIILIGTYDAFDIFTSEFRQIRRGIRQGNIIWAPMPQHDPNDRSWPHLLERLWQYQYTRQPVPLTADLDNALYYCTQGITELAGVAFMLAQERAITTGAEKLTPDIIYSVNRDDMGLATDYLENMHSRNTANLQYNDLTPPVRGERPVQAGPSPRKNNPPAAENRPAAEVVLPAEDLRHDLADGINDGQAHDRLKRRGVIGAATPYVPKDGGK